MYSILSIIAILNGVACLAAGIFVFIKHRGSALNRTFAIFAILMGLWGIGHLFGNELDLDENLKLLPYLGGFFVANAYLHFTYAVLGKKNLRFLLWGGYALNLILFGLVFMDGMGMELLKPNLIYNIWLGLAGVTIFYSLYLLLITYETASGIKKSQTKYVFIEYILALLVSGGVLLLNYDSGSNPGFNVLNSPHLLSALHVLIVYYLFIQYEFLKLKILIPNVLKKILAFSIAAGVGFTLFKLSGIFLEAEYLTYSRFLIFAFVVLAYNQAIIFLTGKAFKATSLDHFTRIVDEYKNRNTFYESIESIQEDVQKNFCERVGIREGKIILLDLEGGTSKYPNLEKHCRETKENFLVAAEEEYLQDNNHIECSYLEELKSLGDVCFPLYQNTSELFGFFVIQGKLNEDVYIKEELEILEGVVHYLVLSLMGVLYTEKLRQQAEEMRKSYEELKKLDDAKDTFISVSSHELRTPMTVAKGYADMLLSGSFGDMNAQQKDFGERIRASIEGLLELVNDMLDISKLDADQMEFHYADVNLKELMKKMEKIYSEKCKEKKEGKLEISFTNNLKEEEMVIKSDIKRLERVVTSIITNAYKFTPEGKIDVTLGKYEKNPYFLKFSVKDTGPGIPKKDQERIFEKFYQVDSFLEKTYTGTGLGLAIVKAILEKMGGKIWVESDEVKKDGSNFIFLIPFKK